MRWAKRRHPMKKGPWLYKKYWGTGNDQRKWVFAATTMAEDGKRGTLEMYSLPGTSIVRHKKVKGDYNPYDPAWEVYGETLRQERMLKNMSYRMEWAKLYANQKGLCALCGHEMDMDTGWHDHHIEYRVNGGSDALGNRVLLHPNCHSQVHSLALKVVKPVPV